MRSISVALLSLLPRVSRRIPGPLVALTAAAIAVAVAGLLLPDLDVATIGSRFGELPPRPPRPLLPWALGSFDFDLARGAGDGTNDG